MITEIIALSILCLKEYEMTHAHTRVQRNRDQTYRGKVSAAMHTLNYTPTHKSYFHHGPLFNVWRCRCLSGLEAVSELLTVLSPSVYECVRVCVMFVCAGHYAVYWMDGWMDIHGHLLCCPMRRVLHTHTHTLPHPHTVPH